MLGHTELHKFGSSKGPEKLKKIKNLHSENQNSEPTPKNNFKKLGTSIYLTYEIRLVTSGMAPSK